MYRVCWEKNINHTFGFGFGRWFAISYANCDSAVRWTGLSATEVPGSHAIFFSSSHYDRWRWRKAGPYYQGLMCFFFAVAAVIKFDALPTNCSPLPGSHVVFFSNSHYDDDDDDDEKPIPGTRVSCDFFSRERIRRWWRQANHVLLGRYQEFIRLIVFNGHGNHLFGHGWRPVWA